MSTAGRSMIRLLDQTEAQAAPDAIYIDFAMQCEVAARCARKVLSLHIAAELDPPQLRY